MVTLDDSITKTSWIQPIHIVMAEALPAQAKPGKHIHVSSS